MIRNKTVGILSKKTSYDIWIGENLLKQKNKDLGLILAHKKIAINQISGILGIVKSEEWLEESHGFTLRSGWS